MAERSLEEIEDEFDSEWTNYGDVNPDEHGGCFVRWDNDHWEIVDTIRADAAMPDGDGNTQIVSTLWIYPDDVWVDGETDKGFTENMEKILESLDDEHHMEYPASPPFVDRIAYYVADLIHYIHDERAEFVEYDDYEELVASYGVDDWD